MVAVVETICDSIAIKFLHEHAILIGRGNELHLFEIDNPIESIENHFIEKKLEIDFRNKIHSIESVSSEIGNIILIFGGREFLLAICDCKYQLNAFYTAQLSDWISTGIFLKHCEQLVLLTAHSVVLRFEYNAKQHSCNLIDHVSCVDKSTIYSSKLYGNAWKDLVVFAGNAFGELIIWQPDLVQMNSKENSKQYAKVLLQQVAHSGAIFSIDYDDHRKVLITAGDDRSVKFWQIKSTTSDHSFWYEVNLKPIASSYGHTARVFHCLFITYDDVLYAVSAGEDSFICIWNSNGELLFKRCQQFGATIWKLAYNHETQTVFTVGSTGNLTAFGLRNLFVRTENPNCIQLTLPKVGDANIDEYIAKVRFLNPLQLVGITNRNRLFLLTASNKKSQSFRVEDVLWKPIAVTINFKCTVMEVHKNFIAICGNKRLLIMLHSEECNQFSIIYDGLGVNGIIRKFIFFQAYKYMISDDMGNCIVSIIKKNITSKFQLPKSKESWLTAALLLNDDQNLIVSNRQGHLLLYKYNADENRYHLKQIIRNVHGNLGATSLYLNLEFSLDQQVLVCSTGHDNAINTFCIDFMNCTMRRCSRDTVPVAWAETIIHHSALNDIIIGFNNNNFVVWSRDYDFLLQVPCGGGHRSWDYVLSNDEKTISLVFIKSKQVLFYYVPLYNKELITFSTCNKWHRAPCNTIEVCNKELCNPNLIVTAGDDNLIKIYRLSVKGLQFQNEIYCHYSNVKALHLVHLAENDYLIFSGGGRSQFCISQITTQGAFRKTELINCTLKLEEITHVNTKLKTAYEYNLDTDMRIMAIDVLQMNHNLFSIFAGCSDGYLRLLQFVLDTRQIELNKHLFYGKCILHVKCVPENNYVIVSATDGKLRIYDIDLNTSFLELSHHSSGINGLSILYTGSSGMLQILTGGDDEVVAYTQIQLLPSYGNMKVRHEFRKSSWHSAQVTAAFIERNGIYGFTSGLDQFVYKINLDRSEVIEKFHTCIADIKGLTLWLHCNCNYILIYGCGFQMITFDTTANSTKTKIGELQK